MAQILVVDDEQLVRQIASRILTEEGHRVLEAADGRQAYDLIQREFSSLDLVVTDVIMPHLTGVELLERMSTLCPGLPVVLMSGYGAAQLAERGIAAPCGVIPKPFAPQALIEEVRRCLGQQRAPAF